MPIVDFVVEAGDTFATLSRFHQMAQTMNLDLNQIATTFRQVSDNGQTFTTQITGITQQGQRLTTTFREEAGALVILNQRLTENAAGMRTAAAAAQIRARANDAATARATLGSSLSLGGLKPTQANAVDSQVNSIITMIQRGRATLADFNTAAAAAAGNFPVAILNEAEHQILNKLNRINAITKQATDKARALLAEDKQQRVGGRLGQGIAYKLNQRFSSQLGDADPAAVERVRRQIDAIQKLFDRGLTGGQYRNAFKAYVTGATANLDELEREVRHRLERIQIEVDKVPKKSGGGFLAKLFGGAGDTGGGAIGGLGGIGRVAGGLFVATGVQRAAEGIKSQVSDAADYSKQIALLQTLTQDTTHSFDEWSTSILKVSNAVGKSRGEIAQAGYDLLSNQVTKGVADTEAALEHAAKFAVVTNSSTQDSVNLLSSVINSFGYEAGNTESILSKLFTVIDLGRVKASDLANSLGRPAVAARALGASFEELGAAQITISQTGLGAEQTNTLITNVFHKLLNPTKQLQEYYDKLGVSTGENFVKTYGFAGALRKLTQETGGSSAKIAEFFNEIRGEQGFTQLATRIGVFEDALKKLTSTEADTLKGAEKLFENLPGQQFYREMERFNNAFLYFKETALNSIIAVTKPFGGLGDILVQVSYLTSSLAVILGGLYAKSKWDLFAESIGGVTTEMTLLTGATGFAAISVGTFLGTAVAILYDRYQEGVHLAERLQALAAETAKAQGEAAAKGHDIELTSNTKAFQRMRENVLQYTAAVKAALVEEAETLKKNYEKTGNALKDTFELASKAMKRAIADGEARQKAAAENVKQTRERLISARKDSGDALYERRLKANELNVAAGGQDVEGRLQIGRINQLRNQARKLSDSDNPLDAQRALEAISEAKKLAQQRALQTTPIHTFDTEGNVIATGEIFKYGNGMRLANGLAREQEAIINRIGRANAKIEKEQALANENKKRELEQFETAAKKVFNFDFVDKAGKFIGGSPEKAKQQRDENVTEYRRLLPTVVPAHTLLGHGQTLKDFLKDQDEAFDKHLQAGDKIIENEKKQQEVTKESEKTVKAFADAELKLRALNSQKTEAVTRLGISKESAIASGNVVKATGEPGFFDDVKNAFSGKSFAEQRKLPTGITDSIGAVQKSLGANDFKGALGTIGEIQDKMKGLSANQSTILDKSGQSTTLENFIKNWKTEILLAQDAAEGLRNVTKEEDELVRKSGNITAQLASVGKQFVELKTSIGDIGAVSGPAFNAVNEKVIEFVKELAAANTEMSNLEAAANRIREAQQGNTPIVRDPGSITGQKQSLVGPPAPEGLFLGGQVRYRAEGGSLQDFYSGKYGRGSDRIPVMAANNEVMMNSRAAGQWLPQLIAMNAGFEPSFGGKGKGGSTTNIGDIHVHVKGGDSPTQDARAMAIEIRRQIRRGVLNP